MKLTNQEIEKALVLSGLPEGCKIRTIEAWYSAKTLGRAVSGKSNIPEIEALPDVHVVRIDLPSGCLELHPTEQGNIQIKCYCCFGGNPDRGTYTLDKLGEAIFKLKDHYCPPWPG